MACCVLRAACTNRLPLGQERARHPIYSERAPQLSVFMSYVQYLFGVGDAALERVCVHTCIYRVNWCTSCTHACNLCSWIRPECSVGIALRRLKWFMWKREALTLWQRSAVWLYIETFLIEHCSILQMHLSHKRVQPKNKLYRQSSVLFWKVYSP